MEREQLVRLTMMAFLTLASGAAVSAVTTTTEKCYGIVKLGMNDCATSTQSCAGSATKDRQSDAFIFLPKGICNKIVGGHLVPTTEKE